MVNHTQELNDNFRKAMGVWGKLVMTKGVSNLPSDTQMTLFKAVQTFNDFTESNDPYGEHDFGKVTVDGLDFFWKIDYYDRSLQYGSPNPSDPRVTTRVLTVMLTREY